MLGDFRLCSHPEYEACSKSGQRNRTWPVQGNLLSSFNSSTLRTWLEGFSFCPMFFSHGGSPGYHGCFKTKSWSSMTWMICGYPPAIDGKPWSQCSLRWLGLCGVSPWVRNGWVPIDWKTRWVGLEILRRPWKTMQKHAKPLNPLVVLHFLSINIGILWGERKYPMFRRTHLSLTNYFAHMDQWIKVNSSWVVWRIWMIYW